MREEIRQKLDAIAYDLKVLADELRMDPAQDAQLASRCVSQSMGFMDMELSNAYGIRLRPNKRPVMEEVAEAVEVPVAEEPVAEEPVKVATAPKKPSTPKKNSPV
jgi:hypothetical protein